MKVAIGCDNAGFPLKEVVTELLHEDYADIEVTDFGVPDAADPEYYPDVAERGGAGRKETVTAAS